MGTFILGPKPVNWCSPGLVTPWTSGVCSPLWAQSSHLYSGDGGFQRGLSPPSCSVRGFPEGSLGLAWGNSSNHCHASPKPCSVPGSPPPSLLPPEALQLDSAPYLAVIQCLQHFQMSGPKLTPPPHLPSIFSLPGMAPPPISTQTPKPAPMGHLPSSSPSHPLCPFL